MYDISYVGIIAAAVAYFLLGSAWYTFLLGKQWRAEMGITEAQAEGAKPTAALLVRSIIVALVIAFTLAHLIKAGGMGYGFKVGVGTGAGIGAAILAQNYAYEGRSTKFWLINAVYMIVGLAAMGVIVGWFQRS